MPRLFGTDGVRGLANRDLTAGLIAFAAQRFIPPRRPALLLYALLVMAFSLYWEAGYLIQAMTKDSGDAVFAYRELVGAPPQKASIAAPPSATTG